jgi:hypothetical protein
MERVEKLGPSESVFDGPIPPRVKSRRHQSSPVSSPAMMEPGAGSARTRFDGPNSKRRPNPSAGSIASLPSRPPNRPAHARARTPLQVWSRSSSSSRPGPERSTTPKNPHCWTVAFDRHLRMTNVHATANLYLSRPPTLLAGSDRGVLPCEFPGPLLSGVLPSRFFLFLLFLFFLAP